MAETATGKSGSKTTRGGNPELALRELKRYNDLKSKRTSVFDPAWQTLANYFLPNLSDIDVEKTEGTTGWSDRIYDTTAIEDARTCTTGQSNWATPAAEPWFAYSAPKALNTEEDDDPAIWYAVCTEIALEELARSNYYTKSGGQYKSRTVFGTGQLHIEEGRKRLINCSTRKIGTYCIDVDEEGIVDTVYTEFKLTARTAEQKFGKDNLPPKILKALDDSGGKGIDREFTFLHVIRPREEVEKEFGKSDGPNKPIASIYIGIDDKWVIRIGGYDEMPDSVTRFDDWGTDSPWGYSPAFETLPNVRQLNYVTRFIDAQAELRANPRILMPIGLFGQVDLRPGGMTPYDPNMAGMNKPEEWMTEADINTTDELNKTKRDAVHRMFYTDVFKALSQMQQTYKRPPTAYEIQKLLGENLEQLSPMFGRLITEKTDVDLRRVFGILFRAGKFPPPPRSLFVPTGDGRKLGLAMPEVTYTSRLALALKSLQNRATTDTLQFVSEFAVNTNRPEILDNFDLDGEVRKFALNQGMRASSLRKMRDVIKIRSARAQQMAQERAMALAEQASKAAKNVGSAPEKIQKSVTDAIPETGVAA